MRRGLRLGVLIALTSLGCGGKEADYSIADFRRLESRFWRFGHSDGYQFVLEQDCTARNGTGKTAMLPLEVCNDLKAFAASGAMVDAVRGPACTETETDVALLLTLDVADHHLTRTEVCPFNEPYRTLITKIDAIRGKILPD